MQFRIDGLDRRKNGDAGAGYADDVGQVYGVLDDIGLFQKIGRDIDRRIGDHQGPGIGGGVDQINVADPPRGAKPGLGQGHLVHQLVGVQRALHQKAGLALADQGDGLGGALMAVGGVEAGIVREVGADIGRGLFQLGLRTDQNRRDQPGLRRLDRRLQGVVIARMTDGGAGRGRRGDGAPGAIDQGLSPGVGREGGFLAHGLGVNLSREGQGRGFRPFGINGSKGREWAHYPEDPE